MLPFCVIALKRFGWKIERDARSTLYGCAVGFSGAAGQLVLFWVLTKGPAYILFPIICLSPAVTIILTALLLKERTHAIGATGIDSTSTRLERLLRISDSEPNF